MNIYARIMARGGGSELRDKNIRKVGGVPMIARSVHTLKRCSWIKRVILWTEDARILRACRDLDVMHVPRSLAQTFYNAGFSNPNDWGEYLDSEMHKSLGRAADVLVSINCNYPLVKASTLDRMFRRLMDHPSASSITAVVPVDPGLVTLNEKTGMMFPIWLHRGLDRQNYPPLYRLTGIHIQHRKRFDIHNFGLKELYHVISRIEGLDVQDEETLKMANYYATKR